jgi:hypothetical protein
MAWAANLIVALKFEGRMKISKNLPVHITTILA